MSRSSSPIMSRTSSFNERVEPHIHQWQLPGQRASPVHLPISEWSRWEENHEEGQDVIRDEISRLTELENRLSRGLVIDPPRATNSRGVSPSVFDRLDANSDGVVDRREFDEGVRRGIVRSPDTLHSLYRAPDDTYRAPDDTYRAPDDIHADPRPTHDPPREPRPPSRHSPTQPTHPHESDRSSSASASPTKSAAAHQIIAALETALAEASEVEAANDQEIEALRQALRLQEDRSTKAEHRGAQLEAECRNSRHSGSHTAQIAELQAQLAESKLALAEAVAANEVDSQCSRHNRELHEQLRAADEALARSQAKEAATVDEHTRALAEFDSFGSEVTQRIRRLEGMLLDKDVEITVLRQEVAGASNAEQQQSMLELQEALRLAKVDMDSARSALQAAATTKERDSARAVSWVQGLEEALCEARTAEAAKRQELQFVHELAAAREQQAEAADRKILQLELRLTELPERDSREVQLLGRVAELQAKVRAAEAERKQWAREPAALAGNPAAVQQLTAQLAQETAKAAAADKRAHDLQQRLGRAERENQIATEATHLMVQGHNQEMYQLQHALDDAQLAASRRRTADSEAQTAQAIQNAVRSQGSARQPGELQSRIAELERQAPDAPKTRAHLAKEAAEAALKTLRSLSPKTGALQAGALRAISPKAGALASRHAERSSVWESLKALRNWQANVKWQAFARKRRY